MAATTAGAIKAVVEGGGLGVPAFRNAAPTREDANGNKVVAVPLPYVTVQDEVALTPAADGPYDRDVTHNVREVVQVDLWQRWRDDTGKVAEDYALPGALRRLLHGAPLPPAPGRVYGCRVTGSVRLVEPDTNVVHHALTLTIDRRA